MMRLRESIQTYLYRLVHSDLHGPLAAFLLILLRLASLLYEWGVNMKLALYR